MIAKRKIMPGAISVGFVGSYIPRRCGIATFTHDLATAVSLQMGETLGEGDMIQIVALNNVPEGYPYPPQVRFEIRDRFRDDYREAAEFLNVAPIDVVCLQHEFGILGGEDLSYVLALLGNLKKPVVTTLHTVPDKPNDRQKYNLQKVCALSTFVMVMAERASSMLTDIYGVPEDKIKFVHHGVPNVPFADTSFYKDQFHVEGRPVLLTFGLLGPNKGIETAIDAVAEIVEEFPDVAYIVLGATHPAVKKYRGEEYRVSLERMVKQKKLTENVIFHNRYVELEQLCEFLLASDIYITPYGSREQIVSGTLAYAIGCGKAIISTPYWYAEEMLANGRGMMMPFGDSKALAQSLVKLLRKDTTRNRMRKRAYLLGRKMVWEEVARNYLNVYEEAVESFASLPPQLILCKRVVPQPSIPEVDLKHLRALTDDTGLLQHAVHATPDRRYGYCTDDNARALVVAAQNWRLFKDESIIPLFQTYLSFLHHAFNEELGRFRNFMAYNRQWLEEAGSEDSHGRALWGLGAAVAFAPTEPILGLASRLFNQALPAVEKLHAPRTLAFALIGIHEYLRRFSGASDARRLRENVARRLYSEFRKNSADNWPWCEKIVTYCNARLPHALILAGRWMDDNEMLQQGLRSLNWLFEIQTDPKNDHLSIIGNDGWYTRNGTRAKFDQQPVEVAALIEAAREAYLVTGDKKWHDWMITGLNWFLGANDIREPIYDFTTGGGRDGLHLAGVNANQGAESTLSWLLSLHNVYTIEQSVAVLRKEPEEIGEEKKKPAAKKKPARAKAKSKPVATALLESGSSSRRK